MLPASVALSGAFGNGNMGAAVTAIRDAAEQVARAFCRNGTEPSHNETVSRTQSYNAANPWAAALLES